MSDNRATPITPTEEGCAGWTAKTGSSAEVVKKIKWNNNFDRQSPEPDFISAAELPRPLFREVPVHVTRAPNRSVQAIPPPSAQPQALPSRRKDEGRRRPKRLGGNGDGDGSDSDSGGDGRRNDRQGPDDPLLRRKPLQPETEPSSQDTPRLKKMIAAQKPLVLSPEEEERVQNLKRLHAFENTLGDRLELRHLNRAGSKQKRDTLLQQRRPELRTFRHSDHSPVKIEQCQAYLNEYLDESLYSAIVDDRLSTENGQNEDQTAIVDLIARTESWLTGILKGELSRQGFIFSDQESWPGTAIQIVLNSGVYDESHPGLPPRLELQLPYALVADTRVPIIHLDRERRRELTWNKDIIACHYLRCITDDPSQEDFAGLPMNELLSYSGRIPSKPKQLTQGYIDLLRDTVGKRYFDDLIVRSRQRVAIENYRKSMSAINMSVSQEFFQAGSDVDLVLFKGGRPSTIRKVLPHELARMGWRQGIWFDQVIQQSVVSRYWRYATFDDHPNEVFVVDMDGDVLNACGRQMEETSV